MMLFAARRLLLLQRPIYPLPCLAKHCKHVLCMLVGQRKAKVGNCLPDMGAVHLSGAPPPGVCGVEEVGECQAPVQGTLSRSTPKIKDPNPKYVILRVMRLIPQD